METIEKKTPEEIIFSLNPNSIGELVKKITTACPSIVMNIKIDPSLKNGYIIEIDMDSIEK